MRHQTDLQLRVPQLAQQTQRKKVARRVQAGARQLPRALPSHAKGAWRRQQRQQVKQQQRERGRQGHRKMRGLLQQHLPVEASVALGFGAGRQQQQLLQEERQRMRERLLLLLHQPLRLLLLLQLHQLRQPSLQPPRQ
jgi:hypothetical protein